MTGSWWLYLLECRGGRLYTGIAKDVEARFARHVAGKGAKYTRANPPRRILGREPHADRSTAQRAEYALRKKTPAEKRRWARAQRNLPIGT